ncbi:MAG: hypothetical protein IT341_10480 [Chloroflexi bacterium]|nr:hypothetical protein [Chloroflexota bacterium]
MKRHDLRYKVVTVPDGTRRLICGQRGCGEPIVGARTNFIGRWMYGVHGSDFDAGLYSTVADTMALDGEAGMSI